jgi:PAS domain S-box-containing protein
MKHPLRLGLRLRLLALVLLALLPAFGLIIFNAVENYRRAADEVNGTARRLVRQAAQNHEQMIDDAYRLLTLLTRAPQILLHSQACHRLLIDISAGYPNFSNILVADSRGTVTCSSQSGYIGINYADRGWFRDAITVREFVASEFLLGRVTTKPTAVFAAPVLNAAGAVQAIVSVAARLDWINQLIEHERLPRGSTFTILDWNGTILARHPEPAKWLGRSYPSEKLVQTIVRDHQEGTIALAGLDTVERLYAYKPLRMYQSPQTWFVTIGIPKETAYGMIRRALAQNLAIMAMVAVLVLAVAWFGSTTLILKPIRALVDASAKLGKGDVSARTGMEQRRDEIGRLASAFDDMAAAIQARELDQKKAEQTRAQLAVIVESSSDAIVSSTLDGIVTSWNKGAEDLFGYSADEMIGNSIMLLVPADRMDRVIRSFESIKQGIRVSSYETVRIRKNGATVAVSVTVSPILDDQGNVTGASSITRDISRSKRSENELRALHEINLAISSTLNQQAILEILLEKIEVLLPYSASHIRLVNEATGKFDPVACRNLDEQQWKTGEAGSHHVILRGIVRSKRPLVIRNLQTDEAIRRQTFYRQQGLVSYLGMPLFVKDQAIGVLSLLTRAEHDFTEEEIRFVERLAKQAGIAIHNSQLYEGSKKLSETLAVGERHIRALANGLIHAQDEEAKRIAHVLHDESSQLLAMIYISLDELAKELSEVDKKRVETVKNLLDGVENRLRDLSHELHPAMLDHLGLMPSLDYLANQLGKRAGIEVLIDGRLSERLSPLLELTIYRVAQEAFNNIARHSRANMVQVRLLQDEELIQCSIQDDGVGFDAGFSAKAGKQKPHGLGLAGMRERVEAIGGALEILSAPGEGTKLFLSIPKERVVDAPSVTC